MPKFTTIPIEELKKPKMGGPYWLYRDLWWIVTDNYEAVVYVTSPARGIEHYHPQGNLNKNISESILEKMKDKEGFPGTKVQLIEHAFLSHPEYYE